MQLHDYRAFLARLNAAVQQQELLIEQYRSQHHQNQFHWQDVRRHTQAIDKLIAKFRVDEQRQQQKREQKTLDDHALRAHRRSETIK
jgi:flagellar FliJ protein